VTLAHVDRDPAHRRHVHAEPRRSARDERELGDQRDLPEGRRIPAERPSDQDVHAETGEDEDTQADDVLSGAGQDRQLIAGVLGTRRGGSEIFFFGGAQCVFGSPHEVQVSRT
jgi:hypothetical protein